uniref:Transmembrane protein n=1 Tax=Odontella aurita TaxID=265563 RepID=A0A7S4N221_9STRA|mmetsp:Transcript_44798/g.136765  ORF Transcript_44798/g.136765 Transcript_44798/m.136765 type:complete len:142 (+) Transcript_44798:60-485(+)
MASSLSPPAAVVRVINSIANETDSFELPKIMADPLIQHDYQLTVAVLVGLFGFLAVISLSYATTKRKEDEAKAQPGTPSKVSKPSSLKFETPPRPSPTKDAEDTPGKSVKKAVEKGAMGSVATPGGRRSARIASKDTKKED